MANISYDNDTKRGKQVSNELAYNHKKLQGKYNIIWKYLWDHGATRYTDKAGYFTETFWRDGQILTLVG